MPRTASNGRSLKFEVVTIVTVVRRVMSFLPGADDSHMDYWKNRCSHYIALHTCGVTHCPLRLGDISKEHRLVSSRQAPEVVGFERSLAYERRELLLRMLHRLRRPLPGPLDAAAVEARLRAVHDV
jgi:hypothetical protein